MMKRFRSVTKPTPTPTPTGHQFRKRLFFDESGVRPFSTPEENIALSTRKDKEEEKIKSKKKARKSSREKIQTRQTTSLPDFKWSAVPSLTKHRRPPKRNYREILPAFHSSSKKKKSKKFT